MSVTYPTGSRTPAVIIPEHPLAGSPQAKAKGAAQDFEGVVLQTMLGEMMTSTGEDGPLGQGAAGGAWRGMLVQNYAQTMARSGGIGVASEVYRDILALQERSGGSSSGSAADRLRAQASQTQAAQTRAALGSTP